MRFIHGPLPPKSRPLLERCAENSRTIGIAIISVYHGIRVYHGRLARFVSRQHGDSGNLIILHHPKQGFVVVGTNDCVYGFDHDWCNNVQRVAVRQGRLIRTMSHLHIAPMIQRSYYLMTYRIEDFSTRTFKKFLSSFFFSDNWEEFLENVFRTYGKIYI